MARNVNTTIVPKVSLHVLTTKKDGTVEEKLINIDDMVADLRYAGGGQNNKVSGRVSNIAFNVAKTKRLYTTVAKAKSWFRYDVTPTILSVDASTEYHSDVREIPVKEIIEDEGTTDVSRVSSYLSYGFHAEILRSDNEVFSFDVKEGDILTNICYLFRGDETVVPSAKLIAIKRDGTTMKPTTLVLNLNNKIRQIPIEQLVNIDTSSQPIDETMAIVDAINPDFTEKQILYVGAGTFPDSIEVAGDIVINGNKVGIWATSKNRDKVNYADETIITGAIKVAKGAKLTIDGCVLTKSALINLVSGCEELVVQNCIVKDLVATNNTRASFIAGYSTDPVKVTITNCYFGNNPMSDSSKVYNLFELNFPLRSGSAINGNYFEKDANTHNFINIYGVTDDAVIDINDNTFEYSSTAVRIGTKGDAKCIININNLTYNSTNESEDGKWAGMMMVQPYKGETTNMANMRININNVKRKDTLQLYFLYSATNPGYLILNEKNAPVVYVNGKEYPRLFNHIISGEIPTPVDKSALDNLISTINADVISSEDNGVFTYQSFSVLADEFDSAKLLMEKTDATQEEVNKKVTTLQAAFNGLVEVTRDHLNDLIEEAKTQLSQDVYTEESVNRVETTIKSIETNLPDNAEKTEVWDAYSQLYDNIRDLELITVDILTAEINRADEKLTQTETKYTEESKTALEEARVAAQNVVENTYASKADVDQAYVVLVNAINGLEEAPAEVIVSKTELIQLIDTANGKLTQTTIEYTEESKTALQNVITDAQAVVDNTNATQEDVNAQITALQSAIDQLVQKENKPSIGEVEVTPGDDDW